MKYKQVYIGIDQSYKNTGITVIGDNKILDIKSVQLEHYESNSIRRRVLAVKLGSLFALVKTKADNITIICERARIHGGGNSFINIDAIKAMGALTAVIVDIAAQNGYDVYSVDTRCWKSQVIGTTKPQQNNYGVDPKKYPTIQWVIKKGFESKILIEVKSKHKNKGTFIRNGIKYRYNDDAADSCGIAYFGVAGDKTKLKLER